MFAINGKTEDFGLDSICYLEDSKLLLNSEDYTTRNTSWVRSIFVHNTMGDEPITILPGYGTAGDELNTLANWQTDKRHAGAACLIGPSGKVYNMCDLLRHASYHATTVNQVSIGIEVYCNAKLQMYQGQFDVLLKLIHKLTARFGIQRQFHGPYLGSSTAVPRLASGGADCIGIFGHRDQTTDRGHGDPGDLIFQMMALAGYEAFDFSQDEDLHTWSSRQQLMNNMWNLGLTQDGVPGPNTVYKMTTVGFTNGLWVHQV
jgi:hypothetical protein